MKSIYPDLEILNRNYLDDLAKREAERVEEYRKMVLSALWKQLYGDCPECRAIAEAYLWEKQDPGMYAAPPRKCGGCRQGG